MMGCLNKGLIFKIQEFFGRKNAWLFVFPVALPLILILLAYLKSDWAWSLTDDFQNLTFRGGVWDRFKEIIADSFGMGELKWTYAAHAAFFYKIFAGMPKAFYILKWLELSGMCFVWGALAYCITRKRAAFFIMPAVALAFRFFYIQFFVISLQEAQAILFLGLAFLAIVHAEFPPEGRQRSSRSRGWCWFLALVAFFLALGMKEPALVGVIAMGVALVWLGSSYHRDRGLVVVGAVLVIGAIFYGLFLKCVISHGNTSTYSFTDVSKLVFNIKFWAKDSLRHHMPWMVVAGWIFWKTGGLPSWASYSPKERFALVLGSALYLGWLAVLLPWNMNANHASPYGVYFAFLFTIIMAHRWEKLSDHAVAGLLVFMLLFNLYILQNELYNARTANTDVQSLWQYIKGNDAFQLNDRQGRIFCNVFEPAQAIPKHANRWWGLELKNFNFVSDFSAAEKAGATYFVVYVDGGTKEGILRDGWQIEFYSKFWRVYRKQI